MDAFVNSTKTHVDSLSQFIVNTPGIILLDILVYMVLPPVIVNTRADILPSSVWDIVVHTGLRNGRSSKVASEICRGHSYDCGYV